MILFLLFPIINALYDYTRIRKEKSINHTLEAVIRLVIIGLIAQGNILLILLACSIFWIVFEISLNFLRSLPLLYIGYTAWSDKTIRRISPQNPEIYFLGIKLIVLILSICLNLIY